MNEYAILFDHIAFGLSMWIVGFENVAQSEVGRSRKSSGRSLCLVSRYGCHTSTLVFVRESMRYRIAVWTYLESDGLLLKLVRFDHTVLIAYVATVVRRRAAFDVFDQVLGKCLFNDRFKQQWVTLRPFNANAVSSVSFRTFSLLHWVVFLRLLRFRLLLCIS